MDNVYSVEIRTIVNIMRVYNIGYGDYTEKRVYWLDRYEQDGGIIYRGCEV